MNPDHKKYYDEGFKAGFLAGQLEVVAKCPPTCPVVYGLSKNGIMWSTFKGKNDTHQGNLEDVELIKK